jgi:DNA-binding NtrC family response regulator
MERPVAAVVMAEEGDCLALCSFLQRQDYRAAPLHSLMTLEREIERGEVQVAILDFDSLPVNNRLFRDLKKINPGVRIIGLSSRPFHPDLEEAFSAHISVCLAKPVDWDELIYWLRSLGEEERSPRDSSAA